MRNAHPLTLSVATADAVSTVTTQSPASPSPGASPFSPASPLEEPATPLHLPPAARHTHSPTISNSDPLSPANRPLSPSSLYTISATAVSVSFLHTIPSPAELRHSNPLRLSFRGQGQLEAGFQAEWAERSVWVSRRGTVMLVGGFVGVWVRTTRMSSGP